MDLASAILEEIALRYQMALPNNSANKQSTVLRVSNNIETKALLGHPNIEVGDKSTVLRVPNNIEPEALLEHPEI